ncbi:hypothetical protein Tco_0872760 [Tanacetum coccineum]
MEDHSCHQPQTSTLLYTQQIFPPKPLSTVYASLSPSLGTVHIRPKLSPPPFPTPHMGSCHLGNPFDVHWARKINGRDDLDWAPLKMNGQDDVELLLTKETHYMSCLSKQTQEEETRKKT